MLYDLPLVDSILSLPSVKQIIYQNDQQIICILVLTFLFHTQMHVITIKQLLKADHRQKCAAQQVEENQFHGVSSTMKWILTFISMGCYH